MRTTAWILPITLMVLCGCKNGPKPPTSPRAEDPVVNIVKNVNAQKKRLVMSNDLDQLRIYIYDASLVNDRMPTKEMILADVKKAAPNIGKLIESGEIVLTGTNQREGVWAYEREAPESGGMVLTSNGIERLTAAELKQRMAQP